MIREFFKGLFQPIVLGILSPAILTGFLLGFIAGVFWISCQRGWEFSAKCVTWACEEV